MFRRPGESALQWQMRNAQERAQEFQEWQKAGAEWLDWKRRKNDFLYGSPSLRRLSWPSRTPQLPRTRQPWESNPTMLEETLKASATARARGAQLLRPSATIQATKPEFNVEHDRQMGMYVHLTFSVANLQGRTGKAVAYFFFANGAPLKDFNGDCCTTTGTVCTAQSFTPAYINTRYKDLVLFMPYFELHMRPGDYNLKFFTSIWDDQRRELAWSDWYPFTFQSA